MKDKQFIVSEIRRIATLRGGEPPGEITFRKETGIAQHEWRGVYWVRWLDAQKEAGFTPGNKWNTALDEQQMLHSLIGLVRKFGRYPLDAEIQIERRNDSSIPVPHTLRRRLGGRPEIIRRLREFCSLNEAYRDVSVILAEEATTAASSKPGKDNVVVLTRQKPSGYVYLAKSGKLYKIGHTANRWQRMNQLDRQTFEGIDELIHTISAYDDAPGIEAYWHRRFRDKNVRKEIFDLSPQDIRAFKKRKWM